MRITIDAAGRLVVPKRLREELGVTAATELDIEVIDGRLELTVPDAPVAVGVGDGFPVFTVEGPPLPTLTADAVRASVKRTRRSTQR